MPDGSTSTHSRPCCDCSAPTNESPIPTAASRSSPKPATSPRSTLGFVATFVPAFAVMLVCIANGKVAIALTATAVAAASALVLAPRCERQIRAHRTYVPSTRTWVLSDVATEPHRGIGDALMREVERCADQASATVVLEVADVNEVAKRLYLKHGFRIFRQRADRLLMRRAVDPT